MDGRYIERIRASLNYARQAADRQETRHIEPEYLLLGLLHDANSNASCILTSLGIPIEPLRNEIQQQSASVHLNPRRGRFLSRQAYEIAATAHKEMWELHDRHFDTEHLLLALVEAKVHVLTKRGVSKEAILKALFELRARDRVNPDPDGGVHRPTAEKVP